MLTSDNYIVRGQLEPDAHINFYHPKSGNTLTQGEIGYLNIVTVCREDSENIDRCQRSVMNQTSTDYDHILIQTEGDPDKNKLIEQHMHLFKGKYVLTLDVDSTLEDKELVEKLRRHNEDIIYHNGSAIVLNGIFQEHFGELDLLVSQKHRCTRSFI
jgi:hypothetical protein|tara:strand:+ start:5676 stop:6146 length:471 start_codon:yes stop_codon:yes gene_type:complete